MTPILTARSLPLLLLAGLASACLAQSPPPSGADAKPTARPAATAKPSAKAASASVPGATLKTLSGADGGAAAGGVAGSDSRLLTREELRTCFRQRDELSQRLAAIQDARTRMDAEKQALTQDQAALRADSDNAGDMKAAVERHNARASELRNDIDAWNKDAVAYAEQVDRNRAKESTRKELTRRQEELKQRQKELEEERAAIRAQGETMTRMLNERTTALNERISDWNQRNEKLVRDAQRLQEERQDWTTGCGNRRYREDDEKALQAGR